MKRVKDLSNLMEAGLKILIFNTIGENDMDFNVLEKDIPTQRIISITRYPTAADLSETIQEAGTALLDYVKEHNLTMTASAFGIYHTPITEHEHGMIEICIPVSDATKGTGEIVFRELEGGKAVCVPITGAQCAFPAILGAYEAATNWMQYNKYNAAQPPREIWHTGPVADPRWEIVWLFN